MKDDLTTARPRLVAKMKEHHGVRVPPRYMPRRFLPEVKAETLTRSQQNALRRAKVTPEGLKTADARQGFRCNGVEGTVAPSIRDSLIRLGLLEKLGEYKFILTSLGEEILSKLPQEIEEVPKFRDRYQKKSREEIRENREKAGYGYDDR